MATTPAPPVEIVPISRLYCSPTNPRSNDAAVPQIAASLRRFGWQQPVVARPDGEVIAGNTRLKAAQQLGMTEVPVWWFHGTDLDATAYAIADNRTHEFAQWDEPALPRLLEQLRAEDSLDGVGFDDEEISRLIASLAAEESADLKDPGAEFASTTPLGSQLAGDSDRDRLVVMNHGAVSFVAGGWKGWICRELRRGGPTRRASRGRAGAFGEARGGDRRRALRRVGESRFSG